MSGPDETSWGPAANDPILEAVSKIEADMAWLRNARIRRALAERVFTQSEVEALLAMVITLTECRCARERKP